jgi:hypothetical protein
MRRRFAPCGEGRLEGRVWCHGCARNSILGGCGGGGQDRMMLAQSVGRGDVRRVCVPS